MVGCRDLKRWTFFAADLPLLFRARLPPNPRHKQKTASWWSTIGAALMVRSPWLGPTMHRLYEHQHPQRPRPACSDRATTRNPSAAPCFLPRRQESAQQQRHRQHQRSRATPAVLTMVRSAAADRAWHTVLHRTARGSEGRIGRGQRGRRRAPAPLSMAEQRAEGGAAAGPGPKRGSAGKTEQGLRLFNTEGRTKQLFRPQDRRRVWMGGCIVACLRASDLVLAELRDGDRVVFVRCFAARLEVFPVPRRVPAYGQRQLVFA